MLLQSRVHTYLIRGSPYRGLTYNLRRFLSSTNRLAMTNLPFKQQQQSGKKCKIETQKRDIRQTVCANMKERERSKFEQS